MLDNYSLIATIPEAMQRNLRVLEGTGHSGERAPGSAHLDIEPLECFKSSGDNRSSFSMAASARIRAALKTRRPGLWTFDSPMASGLLFAVSKCPADDPDETAYRGGTRARARDG
jgi:hypothetical protein